VETVTIVAVDDFADTLAAAQRGDERAFTAIFRAMNSSVVRYLAVLAGNAAEDLAAETWIAALRGFSSFSGDARALRAWLLTIARARWVDSVRVHARRPEVLTDTTPEIAGPDTVHDVVASAMETAEALALIRCLPPDQAEVLTLRVLGELDVGEVAEIMGKTANHVRVLSHRGLRRLAKMVGEKPPEGV
jgi:RNA polymerase sigma-70 factor, ECF subfamily